MTTQLTPYNKSYEKDLSSYHVTIHNLVTNDQVKSADDRHPTKNPEI
jgi:hypothetical protein